MRLVLEIISGPLKGKKIVADEHQVIRVGRTAKSDFPTDDGFMSGEHFAIENEVTAWRIRDLKSRNGTKLNGQKIETAEVKEGDGVHAGSTDFVVHIEMDEAPAGGPGSPKLLTTLPPAVPTGRFPQQDSTDEVPEPLPTSLVNSGRRKRESSKRASNSKKQTSVAPGTIEKKVTKPPVIAEEPAPAKPIVVEVPIPPPPPKPSIAPSALESYEAVTPGGRLLRMLQTQAEPLMALLDATHEPTILKLLQDSGEVFQSLYEDPKSAAIAPYLVNLPPQSSLLQQMVRSGWGHGWGVYLTSRVALPQLRDYFRRELMLRLPDGVELFSRFYEPRYFRTFLDTCTAAEAEKYFGPVSSYLMEGEKPEIVLQFTRTSRGVDKKGHLLSEL